MNNNTDFEWKMPDLNSITLACRIVKEPEFKSVNGRDGEIPYCILRVAANSYFAKKEDPLYIDIECWDKNTEACHNLSKGQAIIVEGRLKQTEWEDKKTNVRRQRTFIRAQKISFLQRQAKITEESGYEQDMNLAGEEIPF